MSLIVDHKVTFRSEVFLAEVAMACRKVGTAPGSNHVNLQTILDELQAHGVESIYAIPGMKRKGRLKIEIIEDDRHEFPAFVKFRPALTMFVQRSVWSRFLEGRSEERVIIAHEIGHIIVHDDEAKPFVGGKNAGTRFFEDEYSAEWQADRVADHLLIPTQLALRLDTAAHIAFTCNVPENFAADRLSNVRSIKRVLNPISLGEPCPVCGDFAVVEEGDKQRCGMCSFSKALTVLAVPQGADQDASRRTNS
jgi:IrrE N-terminal-like domain